MHISIIIPAYNEAANVRPCMESLRSNLSPAMEAEIIFVVNGHSTDGTGAIAAESGARVLGPPTGQRVTIAALRNMGAEASSAPILLFLDADMRLPAEYLATAMEVFHGGFDGVLGFVEDVPEDASWVARTWAWRHACKRPRTMDVDFLDGRNLMAPRTLFDIVGGFDPALETSEDKDFVLRIVQAGRRAVSLPSPRPVHLGCERGLMHYLQKEFWRQNSTLPLLRKYGYSFRLLRNPLVSLWHLVFLVCTASLAVSLPAYSLVTAILWTAPSFFLVGPRLALQSPLMYLQAVALTFLRWNVSSFALASQALAPLFRRTGKGRRP